MGCGNVKPVPPTISSSKAKAEARAKAAAARAERRKLLNPDDFVIKNRKSEAIVKQEGSVAGEQIIIEECQDCDIFLIDHIATVFVDDCSNCRIFIGPVESSVMVRTSTDCDMVIACQQFRSRDCKDCRFALLCTTQPSIETSTNMQFACFDFNYFSLRQQLEKADLKFWNNKWWQIHDFNTNPDRPNWSLLPQQEASKLVRLGACDGFISVDEAVMDRVVPVTLGCRPWPTQESCFVIFLPRTEARVEQLLVVANRSEGWSICRTRSTVLDDDKLKSLLAWAREPKLLGACKGREVTGVQICGHGINNQVQEALDTLGIDVKSARMVPERETQALGKAFFETWRDDI
mmetsp:Transcript_53243/g.105809  ORF Transcript_53243/g.105809 Transcript_53243/m.105809 type:complete len:348 (+) Transcript_53243:67-1110(+)